MSSLILRNKIASKAIILALIMAIAIPPAAFATQAECLAAKAAAIAAAQSQISEAQVAVAIAAAKVVWAALTAMAAKKALDACPLWNIPKKFALAKQALAAKKALDAAVANFKNAWNSLKSANAALAAAQAIDCPPDPPCP